MQSVYRYTFIVVLTALLCAGCGSSPVSVSSSGWSAVFEPLLAEDYARMPDGTHLPIRRWGASEDPQLVILGVHGFSDYGNAFAGLYDALIKDRNGLLQQPPTLRVYAYDQRGHGLTEPLGIWPGAELMREDLRMVATLLRERYPSAHLVIMGESMGGAVALTASAMEPGLDADGIVLLAPAVWGMESMPWYQRLGILLVRQLTPAASFSGRSAAEWGIYPTDDESVARAIQADPLVQKTARADTIYGLTQLMSDALQTTLPQDQDFLVLYGMYDTVIPPRSVCLWLQRIEQNPPDQLQVALYPRGYHLLTRHLQSDFVFNDLSIWLSNSLFNSGITVPARSVELEFENLQYEQSLPEARRIVCSLPGHGFRE